MNSSEASALQIIATTKAGFFSILTVIRNQNGYEIIEPAKYAISHRAAAFLSGYQYVARKRSSTVGILMAITASVYAISRITNGRLPATDFSDANSRDRSRVENSLRSRRFAYASI